MIIKCLFQDMSLMFVIITLTHRLNREFHFEVALPVPNQSHFHQYPFFLRAFQLDSHNWYYHLLKPLP